MRDEMETEDPRQAGSKEQGETPGKDKAHDKEERRKSDRALRNSLEIHGKETGGQKSEKGQD